MYLDTDTILSAKKYLDTRYKILLQMYLDTRYKILLNIYTILKKDQIHLDLKRRLRN